MHYLNLQPTWSQWTCILRFVCCLLFNNMDYNISSNFKCEVFLFCILLIRLCYSIKIIFPWNWLYRIHGMWPSMYTILTKRIFLTQHSRLWIHRCCGVCKSQLTVKNQTQTIQGSYSTLQKNERRKKSTQTAYNWQAKIHAKRKELMRWRYTLRRIICIQWIFLVLFNLFFFLLSLYGNVLMLTMTCCFRF